MAGEVTMANVREYAAKNNCGLFEAAVKLNAPEDVKEQAKREAAEALQQWASSGAEEVGDKAEIKGTGSTGQPLIGEDEALVSFTKDGKYSFVETVKTVGSNLFKGVISIVLTPLTLTSCSRDITYNEYDNTELGVSIVDQADAALLEAIKQLKEEVANLNLNVEKLDLGNINENIATLVAYGKTQNEIMEKIYSKLMETSDDVKTVIELLKDIKIGQSSIYDIIVENNQDIKTHLQSIEEQLKNGNEIGENNSELLKQILAKLGTLHNNDKTTQGILTQILAKLDALIQSGQDMDDNVTAMLNALLEAVNNLSAKTDANHTDYTAKLEALTQAVLSNTAVSAETSKYVKQILDKLSAGAGEGGNVDLSPVVDLLTQILNKIGELGNKADDILAKLAGFDGKLETLIALIGELKNIETENGKKLDSIINKMDVLNLSITAVENAIDSLGVKLDDMHSSYQDFFNNVNVALGKIQDAIQGGSANFDKLMEKLEQILEAVKNHTVDVKVNCECNCKNGGSHEGVLGDMDLG